MSLLVFTLPVESGEKMGLSMELFKIRVLLHILMLDLEIARGNNSI